MADDSLDTSESDVREVQSYTSPVFDLHSQAPAPGPAVPGVPVARSYDPNVAPPGSRVVIGKETIQIAPHPTTNRFPWAPVNNPTVPVYGAVPDQTPPPPPPEPVATPIAAPPPPQPEPVPPPPPEPEPILPAPPLMPFEPPKQPEPEPEPDVAPPPVLAPPPAALAPPPPPPPPPPPQSRDHGVWVYSDYTRKVWRTLKPEKIITVFLVLFVLAAIGAGIALWVMSGASVDFEKLPFMEDLLNSK